MSVFDMDEDPPLRPRCSAIGSLKQYLATNSLGPPRAADGVPQQMVVSLTGVEEEAVTWSSMALVNNGAKRLVVFDAKVLFPLAPDGHKIVIRRDVELFKFVAGKNFSEWLDSAFLNAKIYRSWLGTAATSDEAWPQGK